MSAPLLPKVDAILVLDSDGQRLAGKYYGDFLKSSSTSSDDGSKSTEELRMNFEMSLQQKIAGIVARSDAAEVVSVMGKTAVFCGGSNQGVNGDVRVVHVGPSNESELVLAYLCEGMYDALAQLMGGTTERTMVLDNLELVFLLIDEHCDGGIILETDGGKLSSAVLLRDEEPTDAQMMMMGGGGGPGGTPSMMHHSNHMGMPQQQGIPAGVNPGDMTIGQAFRQAREQWLSSTGM